MSADIPQWAKERATKMCNAEVRSDGYSGTRRVDDYWRRFPSFRAFARYIAAHEEPPVDPLLIEAREMFAEVASLTGKQTGEPGQ